MVTVDDGRQRENSPLRVVDDGIYRRVTDDVQIATEMLVLLFSVLTRLNLNRVVVEQTS